MVADLQLKPLEQGAQQRFGRRTQPVGCEQGKQLQQVHRLRISVRPSGNQRPQLGQFGLLLAVQFSEPPSDLRKQGPAGVVALLQRANQARLTALEVGNGSPERLDPRLPRRDLATGHGGDLLGEQGTPFEAEQAPREELQHAPEQHVPANQHAGRMLRLPIGGHLPANAARRLAGVVEILALGLASELAAHPAAAQRTSDQGAQRVAAARLGVPVQALLLAVFRSLLILLKAALLNLLSLGASLGAITLVFQQGVLGVEPGSTEAFIPVMIFAIVFGLSMDYEMVLLARMHEEWEQIRDAPRAVREGWPPPGGWSPPWRRSWWWSAVASCSAPSGS